MRIFRNKLLLFTLALVAVAIAIMLSALLEGGQNTPLGRAVGAVLTPLESGVTRVGDWFSGVFGYFYRYSDLEAENQRLSAELNALRELESQYWEAVNENEELRRLNNLRQRHKDFDLEPCSVISYDNTGYQSIFTINRGSLSGIAAGDPVVVEAGLVGYVTNNVGPNYASVATLLNQDSKVSALVSRIREVAVIEGDFQLSEQGRLKLAYLRNDAGVRVGDWIETAGSGGDYPKPRGLRIGRVTDVLLESHGSSSYAVVEPVVDLGSLTGVFVVKDFQVVD